MLESNLNKFFKNEASISVLATVTQGTRYGFIMQIDSLTGSYFVPMEGFKSRDFALSELRRKLKQ